MHALRIPLGQFRVGSHRLRVEGDHQIDQSDRIVQLCCLQEVETEEHFIFRCPIYYERRGRFHCLFREPQAISSLFRFPDQRCLALYIQEAFRLRSLSIQSPPRPDSTQRQTVFLTVLPPAQGTNRPTDSSPPDPRSVRPRRTVHTS